MSTLLSTAYFPPVLWMAHVVQAESVHLEAFEHFIKQSYRSRMIIAGPSGPQSLSVPVNRSIKEIQKTPISYQEPWVNNHLRSIRTAYSNSPFFEALYPDIEEVLNGGHETLWSLNQATIAMLLRWLDYPIALTFTEDYATCTEHLDLRTLHPKLENGLEMPTYPQVFDQKLGFFANLSAIDVFFNLGRSSWDYFQELDLQQK